MLPGAPIHVIQRGNNRQACFFADDDHRFCLEWLHEYASKEACRIYAFVLMPSHVHLLLTSESVVGPGRLMKRLGQRYVQYINRTYQRSGTLWVSGDSIRNSVIARPAKGIAESEPSRGGLAPGGSMRLDRAATDSYLLGPSDSRRRSSGSGAAASWLESQALPRRRNQS
ncbi:transposase [Salinisphaera sp.]|uniref:transposase n=1 Tax=Salinisphaera sp. TaxID=1914330 RepID=UPI0025E89236|nr:transposase [Salinisphaera sp.]